MMRGRMAAIAAAIFGAFLVGFIILLATSPTQRGASLNFEIVGKVAPQFGGRTLDGTTYDLAAHRGEWVVINFFASWCVDCRIEHPELVDFAGRHVDGDAQLVAVMFGDSERDASAFFDELGGDWPAIVENTGGIHIDYGVTAVPETVLVSPSGRVVHKWIGSGGVTADAIDEVIAQAQGDD